MSFTSQIKDAFKKDVLKLSWFFLVLSLVSPLVVIDSLIYPYIIGKTLFFEACVELSLITWLLGLITQKAPFFWQKELLIFPFFFLVLFIINGFAFDTNLAFWSNLERSDGFWLYLHLLVWAFLLYQLQNPSRWVLLSKVTLGTGVLVGISALLISITSPESLPILTLERFVGTIGNPAFLAVYMLFMFFLGLNSFVLAKEKWEKGLLIVLCVFFLVILVGTQNRGTLLGFSVGLPLILVLFLKKTSWEKHIAKINTAYLIVILLLGIAIFLNRNSPSITTNPILDRFTDSETFFSRIYNWKIAWNGFLDKIFLGWGLENYTYVFPKYYNPAFYVDNSWYDHPHNVFLGWLVAGGIIGFCAYLGWWFTLILFVKKSSILPSQKAIWAVFLLAFFVHSCFLFDNFISFGIFLGLWVYMLYSQKIAKKTLILSTYYHVVIGGLLLMSGGAFLFITIQTYQTAGDFLKAYNTINIREKTEKYGNLYSKALIGIHDVADIAGFQAIQVDNTETFEDKEAFQTLALDQLNQELVSHPDLGKLLTTKATLLQSRGELEESIKIFEQIRDISPNRPYSWVSLGKVYNENRQYELALEALDKAHKLNPNYFEPFVLKADIYSKMLDTGLVVATIKQLPTSILAKNIKAISQIFQNLSFQKGFVQLISKWEDKEKYNKDTYQEWAENAYKLGDTEQVATAVYSYHRHRYIISDFDPYLRKLQKKLLFEHIDPKPYFELDENFWRLHSTNLNGKYKSI